MTDHTYPWYDSDWLAAYKRSERLLARTDPAKRDAFVEAMNVFRTRPDFAVEHLPGLLGEEQVRSATAVVDELEPTELEQHELEQFGRLVVHDHPVLTELQAEFTELVSTTAGEPVEPYYNFLSLYREMGVCSVHMDSPLAKWTLDVCLEQSEPWPIHFSQIVPWPEGFEDGEAGWADRILDDPELEFTSYALEPRDAVVFSGSSQWHYRDRHPGRGSGHFCHLLFFHYIPAGTRELVQPANWARIFDAPELAPARQGGRRQRLLNAVPPTLKRKVPARIKRRLASRRT